MMPNFAKILKNISAGELLLPGCLIASLLVMFFNIPGPLMDWFLSLNIALSAVILLTTFFVRRPLDFNIFPTLLLATTLFRLTLNIGTTRLILTRADEYGTKAAGGVIEAFSRFVSADSLVVGGVIFAIFVIIQFVVITKGATRISEVAARFTLDALPGRQMAIDADLSAGIIDRETAARRRDELTDMSDFFGAMDGAGKFVRGDAVAGLIIIMVNIVGGVLIGTIQHGRPIAETLATYATLTVGDGLVSQVPALLISLATGILVSRSSRKNNLSKSVLGQLLFHPAVFCIGGVFLFILAGTGLPVFPLTTIGICCFFLAWSLSRKRKAEEEERLRREAQVQEEKARQAQKPSSEGVERYLRVDPMELQIGVGLVRLVQGGAGGETMTDRIARIRNELAADLGIILPKVRVRDRLDLDENRYRICIAGQTAAEGIIWPNMILAVDRAGSGARLFGIRTTDPETGRNGYWIEGKERENGEIFGFEMIEPEEVLARCFKASVLAEADQLLTRDAMGRLVEELHQAAPAVVDDLIPDTLKPSVLLRVLKRLLRERVSIRPLGTIFETLSQVSERTKSPIALAEAVRCRLGRMITDRCRDADGKLRVIQLDPSWEEMIRSQSSWDGDDIRVDLDPDDADDFYRYLDAQFTESAQESEPFVLLTGSAVRPAVFELIRARFPNRAVLGYNEIPRQVEIMSMGVIKRRRIAA